MAFKLPLLEAEEMAILHESLKYNVARWLAAMERVTDHPELQKKLQHALDATIALDVKLRDQSEGGN